MTPFRQLVRSVSLCVSAFALGVVVQWADDGGQLGFGDGMITAVFVLIAATEIVRRYIDWLRS